MRNDNAMMGNSGSALLAVDSCCEIPSHQRTPRKSFYTGQSVETVSAIHKRQYSFFVRY